MKQIAIALILLSCFTTQLSAQKANASEVAMILTSHNNWRNAVSVPDIAYSEQLAEAALTWANQLGADGCAFRHSSTNYGENLFRGSEGYYTAADAVESWASESKDYNYDTNKCNPGAVCGHYTQIVWKNSTEVGCAKVICNGMVTWVCNYNPPGNYVGQKPY